MTGEIEVGAVWDLVVALTACRKMLDDYAVKGRRYWSTEIDEVLTVIDNALQQAAEEGYDADM
jgi:hypothetical protein